MQITSTVDVRGVEISTKGFPANNGATKRNRSQFICSFKTNSIKCVNRKRTVQNRLRWVAPLQTAFNQAETIVNPLTICTAQFKCVKQHLHSPHDSRTASINILYFWVQVIYSHKVSALFSNKNYLLMSSSTNILGH